MFAGTKIARSGCGNVDIRSFAVRSWRGRSTRIVFARWVLKRWAVAAPMPRAEPVIRIVLLVAVESVVGGIERFVILGEVCRVDFQVVLCFVLLVNLKLRDWIGLDWVESSSIYTVCCTALNPRCGEWSGCGVLADGDIQPSE